MSTFWFVWAPLIVVVLIVNLPTRRPQARRIRVIKGVATVVILTTFALSMADRAEAAVPRQTTAANHDVQCVSSGLGVTAGWIATIGSAPATAGVVTAAAATAASGATIGWYDMCPEYGRALVNFISPLARAYWSGKTLGSWLYQHIWSGNGSYSYHLSGRFCVRRAHDSTKRCFWWRNLPESKMRRAFRGWLSQYNIPARLYVGSLVVAS